MYIAYIRCSKQTQNTSHQHHEIQEYAKANGIKIDKWIEEKISSRKPLNKRQLGQLLEEIKDGDIIISTEVSRIGRSLMEIMGILQTCLTKNCQVWTIKENYRLGNDIQSKVLAFAFGLAAEIERQLISQRSKAALDNLRSMGKKIGRPPSAQNKKLKLSKNTKRIKDLLDKGVSKNQIAKIMEVQYMTLCRFIDRMGLKAEPQT
ncbi:MAG: recombinase family protein [Alphaproteobacteria bacterium]|nr:recombinase family protein [Alphaproteobacteria bacterium]